MRAENFYVKFVVPCDWATREPDSMNNTRLYINDIRVWPRDPSRPPAPSPAPGDEFRLSIPSGVLSGRVIRVFENADGETESWHIEKAAWGGKYAGLSAGLCGLGKFEAMTYDAEIHTSISDEPLTYTDYVAVRYMVGAARAGVRDPEGYAPLDVSPEANRALMKHALAQLLELRRKVQELANNPS